MSTHVVAVMQFPGVNCEAETLRALARAGLEGEVFRWTRPASELGRYGAFVLPGGFSYQDRVRAGALAARDPLLGALAELADEGRPVLGICNGAQVLVEAGLVPGRGKVELALARNRMPRRSGYYSRWVYCRVEPSPCVFTRALPPGTLVPLPVAHGEGRFTASSRTAMPRLLAAGQVPLRYASAAGELAEEFPALPNGAELSAAGVCNAAGNVLAMMPHPERALELGALARGVAGAWSERRLACVQGGGDLAREDGPGAVFFRGLAAHLMEAV
ncbi:MAG: phosphoribosylformylglycinamidine synthase I [Candidatus Eisenbacteria bacterium]|uniref:Phosphoribosylformylglycinamidine synthase I n=1 Tax=Eiseniibacteriota bacterium TaxID=2212470 RepID=A0A933W7Y2_UNCEI|nr:phosphoribosylformylglycinamidine synthase I [Candidatus Eisenbacteria bacterium]